MKNSAVFKTLLIISLFILFVLTLSGGFGYYTPRSLKELWNLGHILLFALFSVYLLRFIPWYAKSPQSKQIIILFLFVIILSFLIEGLQYVIAKGTPDINDVRRNLSGAFLGYVFTGKIPQKFRRAALRILAVVWIAFEFMPSGKALSDEFISYRQFPVLSDFENSFELSRWGGSADFERTSEYSYSGKNSLKIRFGTRKYSGVSLVHFPGDWSAYKFVKFELYYPGYDSLRFTCRIHDREHIKGRQEYSDRFNQSYTVHTGWNEIIIPLDDVKKAPLSRVMDMKNIMEMGIFTVQLKQPRTAYLDAVRLE